MKPNERNRMIENLTEEEVAEFNLLSVKENLNQIERKRIIELVVKYRMFAIKSNLIDMLHPEPYLREILKGNKS
jgi:hypothetical protein